MTFSSHSSQVEGKTMTAWQQSRTETTYGCWPKAFGGPLAAKMILPTRQTERAMDTITKPWLLSDFSLVQRQRHLHSPICHLSKRTKKKKRHSKVVWWKAELEQKSQVFRFTFTLPQCQMRIQLGTASHGDYHSRICCWSITWNSGIFHRFQHRSQALQWTIPMQTTLRRKAWLFSIDLH